MLERFEHPVQREAEDHKGGIERRRENEVSVDRGTKIEKVN